MLPGGPQRCEPEDCFVVAPPLRAPRQGLGTVGGTLPDHRDEVLDELVQGRVLELGQALVVRVVVHAVEQAGGGRLAGQGGVLVGAQVFVAAVGLAAPEGAGLRVQDNAHDGVGVAGQPGGHGCGAVVDAHVLPGGPQRCEPEDCFVVAPPLRAPRQGLGTVGGTLPDHRDEVLDELVQGRVLERRVLLVTAHGLHVARGLTEPGPAYGSGPAS